MRKTHERDLRDGAAPRAALLGYLALGLAAGALLLSFVTWREARAPGPSSASSESGAHTSDEGAFEHRLAELERRVAAASGSWRQPGPESLARRLDALEARVGGAQPPAPETQADGEGSAAPTAEPPPTAHPRYVRLTPPSSVVSVTQAPDGSLAVTSTDPALANQEVVITAERSDGTIERVRARVSGP
ncbi:MAG: hypothetical protein HY908_23320 [Myxococcales bacterium]|nr:hypothetical protein [Myxococcales bacterium]